MADAVSTEWIERVAEDIVNRGPKRVVVNREGEAAHPQRAMSQDIGIDKVFIRYDEWTLGTPHRFMDVAREMYADDWVGDLVPVERDDFGVVVRVYKYHTEGEKRRLLFTLHVSYSGETRRSPGP